MSTQHTPEPWSIDKDYAKVVRSKKGIIICNTSQNNAPHLQYHDAKRIVECVNAMAGVENPSTFAQDMIRIAKRNERRVDELEKLLDELTILLDNGGKIIKDSLAYKAITSIINK